jgi:hypothetical protein
MKRALNKPELRRSINLFRPKVLFIHCHGGLQTNEQTHNEISYLCFEEEKIPTLQDKCDE